MNMNRFAPIALAASLAFASAAAMAKSPAEWLALSSKTSVTLEQALDKAAQAGSGTVIDIELKKSDAGPRYEADVVNAAGERHEIYIDAANGNVVKQKAKGKEKAKNLDRMKEAKITLPQAIETALKTAAGKPVAAELDNHWGKVSYDVEVLQQDGTVSKVKIDAVDSSVLRTKKD